MYIEGKSSDIPKGCSEIDQPIGWRLRHKIGTKHPLLARVLRSHPPQVMSEQLEALWLPKEEAAISAFKAITQVTLTDQMNLAVRGILSTPVSLFDGDEPLSRGKHLVMAFSEWQAGNLIITSDARLGTSYTPEDPLAQGGPISHHRVVDLTDVKRMARISFPGVIVNTQHRLANPEFDGQVLSLDGTEVFRCVNALLVAYSSLKVFRAGKPADFSYIVLNQAEFDKAINWVNCRT